MGKPDVDANASCMVGTTTMVFMRYEPHAICSKGKRSLNPTMQCLDLLYRKLTGVNVSL